MPEKGVKPRATAKSAVSVKTNITQKRRFNDTKKRVNLRFLFCLDFEGKRRKRLSCVPARAVRRVATLQNHEGLRTAFRCGQGLGHGRRTQSRRFDGVENVGQGFDGFLRRVH